MDVKKLKQTIVGGLFGCATAIVVLFVLKVAYVIQFNWFCIMHEKAHQIMK